jgi:outer membrane usher protein
MSPSSLIRSARIIFFFLIASSLSAQGLQTVPIDLFVNSQPQGNVTCQIIGNIVSIEKNKLIESIRPVLDSKTLFSLQNAALSDFIDISQLRSYGIDAKYNPSTLRLDLNVMVQNQESHILKVGSPLVSNFIVEKPADFSAYLNMRTFMNLQTITPDGMPPVSSLPSQLVLQPVVNYKGWVLDVSTTSNVISNWGFNLDYARVSHDFMDSSERLTVGSIFLPITGFMVSEPLYGVEFLQDPKMTQSLYDLFLIKQQFLLSQAATVNVLLNNNNVGSYHLDPGKYVVPNIMFGTGINTLVIKSDNLILQTLVPYDSRLLIQGGMSFAASLGIPQWELDPPIFSGYFLYGITPYLTAGVFSQDGLGNQIGGVEATYATPIGNFHSQFGVSQGIGIDFAGEADYQLAFGYGNYYPVINLSAQYTGRSFLAPGILYSQNPYSWLLSASYSQPLPLDFSLGLGVGYQIGWDLNPNQLTANVTITRPIGKDTNISFILLVSQQSGSSPQVQAMITLNSILNNGKENIFATTSLNTPTASANFYYHPSLSAPYGTFSISKDGEIVSEDASVQYTAPFVDSSLSDSLSPSMNNLSFSGGIALITAGGAFGITRPISDSFAIIVPQDNLLGQTIIANKTPDGYDGMVTDKINIGLSQLLSYTRSTISLSSPTAPVDSSMGAVVRILQPTYKSGTVLVVGTKATVSIVGKLVFEGKPYVYQSGKLASSSHSEEFFTDEDGSFQIYNLTPGVWKMTVDGMETSITVPQTASKQYDVGSIVLEGKK